MSRDLPISEFKAIVTDLADRYPRARVDFVYPWRHAGKKKSRRGEMTQFTVLRHDPETLRFIIDYARDQDATDAND